MIFLILIRRILNCHILMNVVLLAVPWHMLIFQSTSTLSLLLLLVLNLFCLEDLMHLLLLWGVLLMICSNRSGVSLLWSRPNTHSDSSLSSSDHHWLRLSLWWVYDLSISTLISSNTISRYVLPLFKVFCHYFIDWNLTVHK